VCVACSTNTDCVASTGGPYCDPGRGQCVQCVADSQCTFPDKRCDRSTDQCVQCLTGADCDEHVCDPTTHRCVPERDD
jgi:hypothetical protein